MSRLPMTIRRVKLIAVGVSSPRGSVCLGRTVRASGRFGLCLTVDET